MVRLYNRMAWVVFVIVVLIGGLMLNLYAVHQFQKLNMFEKACNTHYQNLFETMCIPTPTYSGVAIPEWSLLVNNQSRNR